jgi:hypothetical protein
MARVYTSVGTIIMVYVIYSFGQGHDVDEKSFVISSVISVLVVGIASFLTGEKDA